MTHPLAPLLTSTPRAIAEAGVDCLVIGSGTSGVTAAAELASRGLRVAIIEAGPLLLTEHVGSGPFANREDIVPGIHDVVRYGTLWTTSDQQQAAQDGMLGPNNNAWSAVGGRTLFWGGCTPRFRDEDFATWPFDAEEVRPWYQRAERLIGVSGAERSEQPPVVSHPSQDRLMTRLAMDGIRATHAPLGVDTGPVRDGRMSRGFDSSVSRLLRHRKFGRIEDGASLSLAAETKALRLNVAGGQVQSVTVQARASGETLEIPARHVILAGSAIQSVRLAMASGLGRDDPLIGRYIGDHLFRQAVLKLPEPIGRKSLYIFIPPTADRPFHVQLQGMFRETWYSPLHATVWLDGDDTGQHLLYYCFGISAPTYDNHLVLRGDKTSLRDYYVVHDRSPDDLRTLAAMSSFTAHVAEALGAELVRTQENGPGAALHEFGGLRMGSDPGSSVTDPDGCFWRVRNLSCTDAAIWPHQGSANSYLTITAIALRNAAKLAERLREA
jgi:glucose dehydrogenase